MITQIIPHQNKTIKRDPVKREKADYTDKSVTR